MDDDSTADRRRQVRISPVATRSRLVDTVPAVFEYLRLTFLVTLRVVRNGNVTLGCTGA
jgi:hypothetical protein